MNGVPDVQSTPVASKYPTTKSGASSQDEATNISENSFSSYGDASVLQHNYSFNDDSSVNDPSGFQRTCRHSPRLLTNGYYLMDEEDSIHISEDGNVTLSTPKISVSYKETIVRVFKKRKSNIGKSLSSLFGTQQPDSIEQDEEFSEIEPLTEEEEDYFDNEEDTVRESDIPTQNGNSCQLGGDQSVQNSSMPSKSRVSSGGFLILNKDHCEFSHDETLWASKKIPPVKTTLPPRQFKVYNPLSVSHKASLRSKKTKDKHYRKIKENDFDTYMAISPFYFLAVICVCFLLFGWRT